MITKFKKCNTCGAPCLNPFSANNMHCTSILSIYSLKTTLWLCITNVKIIFHAADELLSLQYENQITHSQKFLVM